MTGKAVSPLWTSEEAVAATGGCVTRPWRASGVSIDTRTLAPGDLFVALDGDRLDGHDYVADALARGAAAALVHRVPEGVAGDAPLLVVTDTLAGLRALGAAARARTGARVVAVTGSVGKTGTKEALRLVLGAQGATHASAGNLNNHWGAPLSLARLPREAEFAVFELGMNHAGEIAPLTRLVRPHVAVITAIEPAHTAFFRSIEGIADAKAEIFLGLEPGGVAVLNRDNDQYARLAAAARAAGVTRIVSFGTAGERPDVRLVVAEPEATSSRVVAMVGDHRVDYRIGAPGRHWIVNSLGVLGVVHALGADVDAAAAALAGVEVPAGRGRRITIRTSEGPILLIDESYNASPAAMRAAFEVLALAVPGRGGRRIAVLGDMLELGGDAPALHAGLADALAGHPIDLVYATGPDMAHLYRRLPSARRGGHASTAAAMAPLIAEVVRPGDVVMVKGSFGMGMAEIVRRLLTLADAGRSEVCRG